LYPYGNTGRHRVNLLACIIEFPREDAYDLQQYESTAELLNRTAEQEDNAADEVDVDVKFNSKKRKANSVPKKTDKVCIVYR